MNRQRQPGLDRKQGSQLIAGCPVPDSFLFRFRRDVSRAGQIQQLLCRSGNPLVEKNGALALDHIKVTFASFMGPLSAAVGPHPAFPPGGSFSRRLATVFPHGAPPFWKELHALFHIVFGVFVWKILIAHARRNL
jgi:hypothetical protein